MEFIIVVALTILVASLCKAASVSESFFCVAPLLNAFWMIQGGGPRRSSPRRHTCTGQLDIKELQLQQRECSLYTSSTLRREKQGAKTHKQSPRPRGTHTGYTTWCWASKQSNNPPSPCIIGSHMDINNEENLVFALGKPKRRWSAAKISGIWY